MKNKKTKRVASCHQTFKSLKKGQLYLADSPTCQVGDTFIDYEYLRKYQAKIGTLER